MAIGLILLLTAALVGPYFVTWTEYRTVIEAQLSKAIGVPVSTAGPIKLKLLPTPQITLGVVAVGDRASGPWLRAEGLHAELALTSLMRGEIRLTEAMFERPQLELNSGADGSVSLPLPARGSEGTFQLEHFDVHDGTLVIRRPQGDVRLAGLTFDGTAKSMIGPFQIQGVSTTGDAAPVKFTLGTGALEGRRIRLKFGSDIGAIGARVDLDGALVLGVGGPDQAVYEGQAAFSGTFAPPLPAFGGAPAALPWKFSGPLRADLQTAQIDALELRAGADEHGLTATGSARLDLGAAPHVQMALDVRQLDLDRLGLLAAGTTPAAALGMLVAFASEDNRMRPLPVPLDLSLTASVAVFGGEALSDIGLKFAQGAGRQAQVSFAANGPGRSHVAFNGALEPGIAVKINGDLKASAQDAMRLEDWFSGGPGATSGRRPAALAAIKTFAVTGAVEMSATGLAARDLSVTLDRSTYNGTVVYTRALGQSREKLYANLASDRVDIDSLPEFSALPAAVAPLDFSLALVARSLRIARAGETTLELGRVSGKLTKTGDLMALEQLGLANAGGAAVSASATMSAGAGHLEAHIDAVQMTDFAGLLRRAFPGVWSEALSARAQAMQNTKVTLVADAAALGPNGPPVLTAVALNGMVGATKLAAGLKPEAGNVLSLSLQLDAPEAAPLLRQLGLAVPNTSGVGGGKVALAARRRGDLLEDIVADANVAGTALTYRGSGSQGKAGLKSTNIGPLLQVLGVAGPEGGRSGPASGAASEANADLVMSVGEITAQKLAGNLAGAKFDGHLAYRLAAADEAVPALDPAAPRLTGALTLGRMSLAGLASLSLGPFRAAKPDALWSDVAFGPGLANLPPALIALTVANLDVTGTLPGRDATLKLRLLPGKTSVEDLSLNVAGGKVGGWFDIRRDGASAAVAGHLTLDSVPLTPATLKGRMSGSFDFASTGDSSLALVAGLAGSGDLALAQPLITGFDPAALTRILAFSANEKIALADQAVGAAFATELDHAALVLPNLRSSVTIAAGVARIAPLTLAQTPVRIETGASLDLRSFDFSLRSVLGAQAGPKYWTGPAPQVTVVWKGVWPQLERRIDTAPLANGLAAAAIARDSERLAAVEADIRERAFFNRRLKAIEQERQRLAAEQEAARIAAEEDKRRALETAREQSDLLRRQGAEPPRGPVPLPRGIPAVEAQGAGGN